MIFFAEKEHLTKPSCGIFLSDKIIDHGKYTDNWETQEVEWQTLLPEQKLKADQRHFFNRN